MLVYSISHIVSAWFAFILPGYSTFKALAHRPVSDPELEKWSQYWVVISLFVAFEYTLQWLISWLPFYWEIKTLFLLFLSLPQTQGSIYIYTAFVAPYIIANEADIDAGIERLKTQSLSFLHGRLAAAVDTVFKLLTKASTRQQAGDTSQVIPQQGGQQGQGTTPADASNYLGMANGLWRAYGPSVLGALQRGQQIATGGKPTAPGPNPSPSASTTSFAARPYDVSPSSPSFVTPGMPVGSPTNHRNAPDSQAPPFPEPQLH